MILDSLKNSALYYGVSPRMKQAFELIASTDWTTMEPGIHELDGKDIYVNVMERELKQKPDAKLEIHNEYIDIQVLIRGEEESFGWSERRELKKPLGEFSVENDIQLFDDVPQTYASGAVYGAFPRGWARPDGGRGHGAQDHRQGAQVDAVHTFRAGISRPFLCPSGRPAWPVGGGERLRPTSGRK